ncbi:MAG: DUF1189 family protein, partial [Phycisphaerae bacterium]|nr:DUF1189 family protein [Phycisphaerae bacterium]
QTFSFDEVDHFVLEQDMINGWLETARGLVAPIVYVLAVLGAYVFRILQALIYACIGLAFAAMCETKLNYASLIRLSVMSVTPGIIIETVLDTAGIHIPYGFLLYFIIAMGFLFFGVKACVQKHVPPVAIPVAPISPVAPVSPPPSPYAQPEM